MRYFLLLLPLLFLGLTADAQVSVTEVRFAFPSLPTTAPAPTAGNQRASLRGAVAWRVRVQADVGVLNGTGRLAAYHWGVSTLPGCANGCYWRVKQFDCRITELDAGQRRMGCGDWAVRATPPNSPPGIAYVPEGVGVTEGNTVSIEVEVIQQ